MKLAVMQPYFFPYIGYFQLMQAVDEFMLYDNVQFTKDGWIHRNRILINGSESMFTLPLEKGTHTEAINERVLSKDRWPFVRKKLLLSIEQNYRKAEQYEFVYPVINSCFSCDEVNLFQFIRHSIEQIVAYLELSVRLSVASEMDIDHSLKNREKVLALCNCRHADIYINAPGAKHLYDRESFEAKRLQLYFLEPKQDPYPQFGGEFVPWLSIIDVMMFNSKDRIKRMLRNYTLV